MDKEILLSIIVVFLNEEKNLPKLYEEVCKIDTIMPDIKYELILVDDGSSDNSWELAKGYSYINQKVKSIKFSRNFGAISAVIAGIKYSKGKYLVDMAADCQEPIELFLNLLELNLKSGYELSWGIRKTRKDPFISNLFSNGYYFLMRNFVLKNFPKEGLDAFCCSRRVADFLVENYDSTSNMHMLLLWAGFKSGYVYYDRKERVSGKSKWSFSKKMNLFLNTFVSFSYLPLRLVTLLGISFFILGIFWSLYIIISSYVYKNTIIGYASLMSVLLLGFGAVLFGLGIISEYIWRNLEINRKRPLFLVEKKIGFSDE